MIHGEGQAPLALSAVPPGLLAKSPVAGGDYTGAPLSGAFRITQLILENSSRAPKRRKVKREGRRAALGRGTGACFSVRGSLTSVTHHMEDENRNDEESA